MNPPCTSRQTEHAYQARRDTDSTVNTPVQTQRQPGKTVHQSLIPRLCLQRNLCSLFLALLLDPLLSSRCSIIPPSPLLLSRNLTLPHKLDKFKQDMRQPCPYAPERPLG